MLDYNDVRKELTENVKNYEKKLAESESRTRNLSSSLVQLAELSSQSANFGKELNESVQVLISEDKKDEAFSLVLNSLNQLVDFITDKPTVLQFHLDKESGLQNAFSFSIDRTRESLNSLLLKSKANESIEKALLSGENPEKRKVGQRPNKISDVRKAKARLKNKKDGTEESKDK